MKKLFLTLAIIIFSGTLGAEPAQNPSEDGRAMTRQILESYLRECHKKLEDFPQDKYPQYWDENGLCGPLALNNVVITPGQEENGIVPIEVRVQAFKNEFEHPETSHCQKEKQLLGTKLIQAAVDKRSQADGVPLFLDTDTKCQGPLYHHYPNFGQMICCSCVTADEIRHMKTKIVSSMKAKVAPTNLEKEKAWWNIFN